jgi:hypothetical protein
MAFHHAVSLTELIHRYAAGTATTWRFMELESLARPQEAA